MPYKLRRSLHQAVIKLMLLSLLSSTLAGLIPPPLVTSVLPPPAAELVEALLPETSSAQAAPLAQVLPAINGSISFIGGFDPLPNSGTALVSDLNYFNIESAAFAAGGTGNFSTSNGLATAARFDLGISQGTQLLYSRNGYNFYITNIKTVTRTPLRVVGAGVVDDITVMADGYVTHAGNSPTQGQIIFTAQGTGLPNGTGGIQPGATASWSSSISVQGVVYTSPSVTSSGVLTLTKTVIGNPGGVTSYAVTVNGPNGYVTNTTVTAGVNKVLTGLAGGLYTVTETSPGAGWVTTYTVASAPATVLSGQAVVDLSNASSIAAFAAVPVSGRVYRDFNSDGLITANGTITDTGVANVKVTAYGVSGAACGNATSNATGNYSFTPTCAGPWRLVFSDLPSGYEPTTHGSSAGSGPNGTSTQFVTTAAGASNISFGINHPCDYCQSNPNLATTKYVNGDPLLTSKPGGGSVFFPTKDFPAWIQFPYSSGAPGAAVVNNSPPASGTTAYTTLSNAGPVGTLWGLAYQRQSKRLFGAAVVRRHAGLGPLGTGGIYMADLSGGTPTISSFVNLAAAPFNLDTGSFANPRGLDIETASPSHDDEAFGLIGKAGLGALDISADGKDLWLVNLKTRTLHKLAINNPAQTPTLASALSTPANQPWLSSICPNGLERPWAVKMYRAKLYVGTVCTAENSGTAADLSAQVYEYDGTSFTKLLTIPLNYTKGAAYASAEDPGQWYPWLDVYSDAAFNKSGSTVRTQPILSAIEFDANTGNMILGFTDRNGLQFGYQNYKPDGTTNTITGITGGDILLACKSAGAWVVESNGQCPAGSNPSAAGVSNNQGPGNGEFFYDDRQGDASDPTNLTKGVHKDIHVGALAVLPGANDVAMTAMDPFRFATSGVAWLYTANGANERRYEVYQQGTGLTKDRGSFAKAAGLGDLQLLCDAAPIEIGNRVWNDLDGDGVQDANEPGLANITVSRQGPTNTVTTNTDANGLYYFGNLKTNTAYTLTMNVPAGYSLTAANQAALSGASVQSNHAISDTIDSDAGLVGSKATIYYSTGSAGQNNHGLDFGFSQPVKGQVNITNTAPKLDYGDLPDDDSAASSPTSPGYNTNLTGVLGASHVITPGLRIGATEDNESDGQPNADATGDGSDEDGVILPTQISVGQNAVFTVTVLNTGTTSAILYGFIDFSGDGNFNDPGEVVTATIPTNPASQTVQLTFNVPLNSYTAEQIGARFRLSTARNLGGEGSAPDGEVEDYLVQVSATDWGDLPDASAGSATGPTYNTDKTGAVGPSHIINPGLFLGSFEDAESNGQPSATATGDDSAPLGQTDDEEGVTIPSALSTGGTAAFVVRVVNSLNTSATLYGFVDWNGDGDFGDSNESLSLPAASSGDVTLNFTIPLTANVTSLLGARFRLSTDAGLGPDGPASNGEVEDYLVRVGGYDFGDLPDDDGLAGSPTSPAYNTNLTGLLGASHYIIPELRLGATEDNEIDGQPSADASGDGADEDAVTFPAQIIAGNTAIFTVTALNTTGAGATLYGFIDWNGDGDFADAHETVVQPVNSAAGNQIVPLAFNVPLTADTTQQLGARFRLSTDSNLGPDGPASNGEVEDYLIQVLAFDLALRKTVINLSTTPLASTATYNLAVINQGTVTATNIAITDSIDLSMFQAFDTALNPAGTTTGDAALSYTWSNGVATLTGALLPGQTVNLPITLRLAANTLGKTLTNYAEIATATDGNGQPVTDIDSTPENTQLNQNGDKLVDDEVSDNGTLDEDDHDVAYVSVKRFDLALVKNVTSLSPAPLTPGVSVVTFTLTVFNQGDLTTTLPITVVDYPQVGLTFNAADNPGWDGTVATRPARVLTQPIGPGGSITTPIVLRVDSNVTGGTTLYNFAEIAGNGAPVDADSTPDHSNDEAGLDPINPNDDTVKDNVTGEDGKNVPGQDEDDHDVATVVVPVFDLALIKTVASQSGTPLVPGSSLVNFNLTVYNQGAVTAKDITITDYVIPSDFVFDAGLNPTWSNAAHPAKTLPGPLAPGERLTTTITLRVAPGSAGQQLDNFAEISDATVPSTGSGTAVVRLVDVDSTPDSDDANDGTPKDNNTAEFRKLNPADDEDDHDLAVVTAGAFDLALVKRVASTDLPLLPNGLVTFTIELFNQGDIASSGPITVVDYVQPGFTFDPALNPLWDNSVAATPVTTITSAIDPGKSVQVALVLRVNSGTAGQTLLNYAEIAGDGIETDRDSTPDTTNGETPVKDDVTLENGKLNPGVDDEDDHDIASVEIPLPVALGNYVWLDLNRDGLQVGENGLAGATVELFQVLQGGAIITPAQNIDGVLVASVTTAADGLYTFNSLAPGEYVVRVTPPAGYAATQGGADPDDDANSDSNGVPVANQPYVQSLPVLLTVAGEPASDNVDQGGVDENGNGTVDFGFVERRDWGDLPDGSAGSPTAPLYNTDSAGTAGPSHLILPGLHLGSVEDDEVDGQPSATATGDDNIPNTQPDDEDGVELPLQIIADTTATFTVTVVNTRTAAATLYGFVDWNGDGDFGDVGETASKTVGQSASQSVVLTFTVPATATTTLELGARFRLSSDGNLTADGPAPDGEVEDYLVKVAAYDWGDLPDGNANNSANYPTSSASNGPRHQIVPGLGIGPVEDNEVNGQPNSTASGDNNAGLPDDEDGVQIPPAIQQGQSIVITVTVVNSTSRSATLYGFVDWNGDGDFADSGESALVPANASGPVLLSFNVPLTATITQQLGARFRLSSDAVLGPVGRANDGEVEDYLLAVGAIYDWGDLPAGYYTLAADNGPRHLITPTLRLGAVEDNEADGQPTAGADGDDSNLPGQPDDEDGMTLPAQFIAGASATVTATVLNNTGKDAVVYGFIDWNGDGDFADLGEVQTANAPANAASQNVPLNFTVPATATTTSLLGARFRLSTDAALGPNGPASDGEVEDYLIEVTAYDYGDLPDASASSPTGAPNGSPGYNTDKSGVAGAAHIIIPGLYMGAAEDAEADGQPQADASGDDANGNAPDDEDGVTFPASLYPGQSANITVTVVNTTGQAATLYGFIDWNGDGDFGDAGEAITALANASGNVILNFNIPATATITQSVGARFRLSTDTGLGADGLASNGEVEDYLVKLTPPLSLGNRVWEDVNNNGLLDNNEQGINGVRVKLFAGDGVTEIEVGPDGILGTNDDGPGGVLTNATGHYLFAQLPPGDYIVEVTQPAGYTSSSGSNASSTGGYEPAPDEDTTPADGDDNGTLTISPTVRSAVVTLVVGSEPQGETDLGTLPNPAVDANSNLQVDFGFYQPLSLGNEVWIDANNDGLRQPLESYVADGVKVNLYFDADGSDQLNGGETTAISSTTTLDGFYLFAHLRAGNYLVELAATNFQAGGALVGYASSIGADGVTGGPYEGTLTPDPDSDATDGDDNGSTVGVLGSGGSIRSSLITLAVGGEPGNEIPDNDSFTPDRNENLTVDFGLFRPLSLGNLVWNDLNNDGLYDADGVDNTPNTADDEKGLDNVVMELLDNQNNVVSTTNSSSAGLYLFPNLTPGDYTVRVTPPPGYLSSTGVNGKPTGPYESAPDADTVATDNDDNGTSGGGQVVSLPVTLAHDSEPTGENPDNDAVTPDLNENLTVDFALFLPAALGNRVWYDVNKDGVQDDTETGVPGVVVRLYISPTLVTTTTTDGTGHYTFTNLMPGNYVVEFDLPPGYVRSPQDNAGSNPNGDEVDSDADPVTGRTVPINLVAGETDLTWDAGIYFDASLGDRVWFDQNANGLQDGGEPGVPNVTVTLLDSTGNPVPNVNPTQTDADGFYMFPNLPSNDYQVQFTLPTGYVYTQPDVGGNNIFSDTMDSDVNPVDGKTALATLEPNEHDPTWDAGIYLPVSLGNLIWEDKNNNGVVDTGEAGIPSVVVKLFAADGVTEIKVGPDGVLGNGDDNAGDYVTNGSGNYLFTNLKPGDYVVGILAPAGYTSSTGSNASASGPYEPASDPDNDINNDDNGSVASGTVASGQTIKSAPVTLVSGAEPAAPVNNDGDEDKTSNLTVDFGLYQPLSLGNLVWYDLNNDGIADPDGVDNQPNTADDEVGLSNVTVQLYAATSTTLITSTQTNSTGHYLFTNLIAGEYVVAVLKGTVPVGYVTSTGKNGSLTGPNEPAPDEDVLVKDNDDNGSSVGPLVVTTAVTLTVGSEPQNEADRGDIANPVGDANSNTQVDFGFYIPLSLGNLVWEDKNNNGVVDAGEPGLDDVLVKLMAADGVTQIAQTITNNTGHYRFDHLAPGDYVVVVAAPPGYISSTGSNGKASGPYEAAPDPDNDVNNDDNGTTESGEPATGVTIFTSLVTLSVGSEPAAPTNDDEDSDQNSNLSVDFGLFQPLSLGNLVWHDVNNDGKVNNNESGIAEATVNLYGADGTTLIASTTTNATGHYLFTNLISGDYIVEVVQSSLPVGYVTSTGKNGSASGPYEPAPDEDSSPLDNDDNGSITSGTLTSTLTVRSELVTLSSSSEPRAEPDAGDIVDNAQDGNSNLQVDFGFFIPARLGDRVWLDHNRDGVQDGDETGVPGVTVRLYDGQNKLVATTTTGDNGLYLFDNLSPGDYAVEFTLPIGYARSPQDTGGNTPVSDGTDSDADLVTGRTIPINLSEGETDLTWDAGIYFNASLGDRVWYDRNGDGLQDAGEPGVPGVQVTLYNSLNQAVGQPVLTDQNGNYAFHDLPPGNYSVQFTLPLGYIYSPRDTGSNTPFSDALDSDVDPLTGRTIVTDLGLNEHDPTWDAGIFEPVSLGNLVWEDVNNNGKVDGDEPGIADVTVRLYRADGTPVGAPIQTDANGHYLFSNLPPGKYYVEIDAPAGYATSTGLPGSFVGLYEPAPSPENNINHDDNGSATAGSGQVGGVIRSNVVMLTPGQEPLNDEDTDANSNLTVDFGLYRPVTVGDYVWVDKNGNGVQESGEPGVPDVKVTLYNATTNLPVLLNGTPLNTLTDSSGLYRFEELPPGDYYVIFDKTTLPADHIVTQPNVGADDKDSDADSSGRTPSTGFLPSGSQDLTLDLGIYQPVNVGDYVWIDSNDNGLQDNGEPGVKGVTVVLYTTTTGTPVLVDGNPLTKVTDSNGKYLFPNLPPGNYYVVFDLTTLPTGYVPVLPNQGADDKDSDADRSGKTPPTGFLESGQANLTLDLGIQLPPNLVLNKSVAKTEVAPGEVIVYMLVYTNTGPSSARSSVLTETVPTGTTFDPGQSTTGWQCANNGAAGAKCRFTLGDVAPGKGGTLLFAVKLGNNVSALTVIPNVAVVETLSVETQPLDNGGRADVRVQAPQAVSLSLFGAEVQGGAIVLRWQTSVELRTTGYHIYRSSTGRRADARQLTSGLIPSLGLQGGDYTYTDREIELNQTYTYWLVEVDADGQPHEYGPLRFGIFANSVFLPLIDK